MHESQGIVRLIVTLSEYDLATEQRETALSSQAEIYIIGGLLRRDCPAIDSTGVPAYCNPQNEKTRDQEAAWGKVHDPRSKEPDGMVWIYGWKFHAVVDVPTHFLHISSRVGE